MESDAALFVRYNLFTIAKIMQTMNSQSRLAAVALCFAPWIRAAPHAAAQSYPSKPVQMVVPSALLPGLPAIAQSGVPGYRYELWWAIFAPAGMAMERRNFIAAAISHMLTGADMKKFLSEQSAEPWSLSTAQLNELLPKEIERYRKAAKAAGIALQ